MAPPAIVLLAYDRPRSLERVLHSLAHADYGEHQDVRLLISIDRSDCREVVDIAERFEWEHGEKSVVTHEKNLGLREHALYGGDLSGEFGSILLLEDDSFVSRQFYDYAMQARDFFADEPEAAAISLYGYSYNELTGLIFNPLDDGADNYFVQSATTWGVLWTKEKWQCFRDWLGEHGREAVTMDDGVPRLVASWPPTSWKKFLNKYLIVEDKYFVYPRRSLLTNFADAGIHNEAATANYQVPLLAGRRSFSFSALRDSKAVYDAHFEMQAACVKKMAPELEPYDFEMDLFGLKEAARTSRDLLLTVKECGRPHRTFGLELKVPELNVVFGIPGVFFSLASGKDLGGVPWWKRAKLIKQCNNDLGLLRYAGLLGDNAVRLVRHRWHRLRSRDA